MKIIAKGSQDRLPREVTIANAWDFFRDFHHVFAMGTSIALEW